MGRPTDYKEELGDLICEGVSRRVPLAKLCDNDKKLPSCRTVYRWLRTHKAFCQNYTRAKEDQADYLVEEALEIADDASIESSDKRIRVDTRKWIASRFNAKKYGDKQFIETKDTTDDISDEELDNKIRSLMDKASK